MADAKIITYGAQISAGTTAIPDNTAVALNIQDTAGEDYVKIVTTDNSESLSLYAGQGGASVEGIRVVEVNSNAEVLLASEVAFIADPDCMIRNKTGNNLEFRMAGTDIFGIDGSGAYVENGNFGVGTLTPATKFECNGAAVAIGAIATALNGTFTATNGSTAISSGSSTAFTTELHVGSAIKIGSEGTYTVAAIASATALTLDSNFTGSTGSGKSGTTDGGELFAVKTGDSKTLFGVGATGAIQAGSAAADSHLLTNLAIGDSDALDLITTGKRNYVFGHASDNYKFTSGYRNVMAGFAAGEDTSSAWDSIYIGSYCGTAANANYNTFIGAHAGNVATGTAGVAIGREALKECTGSNNVAVGAHALDADGAAANSVAVGFEALTATTGAYNIGVGYEAGDGVTSGGGNLLLGYQADCVHDANYQIAIGFQVVAAAVSTASIGDATRVATLNFGSAGQSWSTTSDERIKENVEDVGLGLDFINALRPIKYTEVNPQDWPEAIRPHVYFDKEKTRTNEDGTEETYIEPAKEREETSPVVVDGLIAQEVKAAADAAGVSFSGWEEQPNGLQRLQYEKFVVPLIRAVQELTARVAELEAGD